MDHDTKTSEQLAHVESHMPADEKRARLESDYSDVDPVLEKQLLKKIDRRLLPVLWVMYIFNYIDRTNIGNARVGGMDTDLNMSSSDYSLVLSIFFISYLLFEVPSNMILARTRPSIFLPTIMFLWGGVSTAMAGVTSVPGAIGFRIVLGVLESGFFPGVMLLMSCWYKPVEMSKRIAIFYTASLLAGAFGGLLAGGIIQAMEMTAGRPFLIARLFVLEGLGTVCFAASAYFILPDYPSTTRWLTDDERQLAVGRLQVSHEPESRSSHQAAFLAALKDPRTWAFMIAYNLLNSVGTISYFFPTLMNALGYTGRMAQFMTVPVYCVALVFALTAGYTADRTGQKAWHVLGACILAAASFVVCVTVRNVGVRYAFICFGGAGIWTAIPIFLSWMVTMFDGREKRAISIALINGVGALSSVYGSFFWPTSDAPQYVMGFAITTALIGAAGVLIAEMKIFFNDKGIAAERRSDPDAVVGEDRA